MKNLKEFEQWLTDEIEDFDNSAKFAQEKGMVRMHVHCITAADTYKMARAVLRTSFVPDRVEEGDLLMSIIANKMRRKGV